MKFTIAGKYYLIAQAIILVATLYSAGCLYLRSLETPVQTVRVQLPIDQCLRIPQPTPPPPVFNLESGKPFKIYL